MTLSLFALVSVGQQTPEARLIEIDLSDLGLSSDVSHVDQLANAISHVYERFVPYADEGWKSSDFAPGSRPTHGLSAYRTRQLTVRPWKAEPGSKLLRTFS